MQPDPINASRVWIESYDNPAHTGELFCTYTHGKGLRFRVILTAYNGEKIDKYFHNINDARKYAEELN